MLARTSLVALLLVVSAAPGMATDRVALGSFAIDRTEVTIERFRAFLAAGKRTSIAEREGGGHEYAGGWVRRAGWTYSTPQGKPGAPDEPATHVTWDEAEAFCRAAGGRLPTRTEWTLAAYTEQRTAPSDGFETGRRYLYPVGDAPEGMNNNRRSHMPVGSTKRGVNGLYDMGANVWEWLADRRGGDALTAGGSWWYGPPQARADGMQWKAADFHALYIGFRCAYGQPRS
jgi:formylglycine-generating enzyme required for sulfatase activity